MATQTYTLLQPGAYGNQTVDLGQATQNRNSNVQAVRVYWQSPDGFTDPAATVQVGIEQSGSRNGPWTNPVTPNSPGFFFGGTFQGGLIDKNTGLPRTSGEIETGLADVEKGTRTYHGTATITGAVTNFGLYLDLIS